MKQNENPDNSWARPPLDTVNDCLREIERSGSHLDSAQREFDQWMFKNPQGHWPGGIATLVEWRSRKEKAEARLVELTSSSQKA